MDRQHIEEWIKQLIQANQQAIQQGDYKQASQLTEVSQKLVEWQAAGNLEAALPQGVIEMLEEIGAQPLPPIPQFPPAEPPPPVDPDAELLLVFRRALANAEAWRTYQMAEHDAQTQQDLIRVIEQAHSEDLKQQAQETLDRKETLRQKRVDELMATAVKIEKEQPGNLSEQERAWLAVMNLKPDHLDAKDRLNNLAARQREIHLSNQLTELELVLDRVSRNITEVEKSIREVEQLITGITDPELKRRANLILQKLNDARNNILRYSDGGASNERAGNFETAIAKYKQAIKDGLETIRDDITGEPLNPYEALLRTQVAFWSDLRTRIGERMSGANTQREKGYPELAVVKLTEALQLVEKIEEGGERERQEIDEALLETTQEASNKETAIGLVAQARAELDPDAARSKLTAAKEKYSKYPDIDVLLAENEKLVLAKAVQQMGDDLNNAEAALARAWIEEDKESAARLFELARSHCQAAQRRGAALSITSEERKGKEKDVADKLEAIKQRELKFNRLWDLLSKTDQALRASDIASARKMLAGFGVDEQADSRFQYRKSQLRTLEISAQINAIEKEIAAGNLDLANKLWDSLLNFLQESEKALPQVLACQQRLIARESDQGKYRRAEAHFRKNEWENAVLVCEELSSSDTFAGRAETLRARAQARLWQRDARLAVQQGTPESAAQAAHLYREILGLQETLPEEDKRLLKEAEDERKALEVQQAQLKELQQRIEGLVVRRSGDEPDWKGWLGEIKSLRKSVPEGLKAVIEEEYKNGLEVWYTLAWEQARNDKIFGQIHSAYTRLKELADNNLIRKENLLEWKLIQYEHFSARASEQLESMEWKDWESAIAQADDMRRNAPEQKQAEAQQKYLETVRRSVLKVGQHLAISANPGPVGAIQYLEGKIEQYPVLSQDAQFRAHLLRYQIDNRAFDQAEKQAEVMRYVAGEESYADIWKQLVGAMRDFSENRQTKAARGFSEVREKLEKADHVGENIEQFHYYLVGRCLNAVREEIGKSDGSQTGGLINRIQALDLIRELDPEDEKAAQSLRALSDQLSGLVGPLRERSDKLKLQEKLSTSLKAATDLLAEIRSVMRSLDLVAGAASLKQALLEPESSTTRKADTWQTASSALGRLGTLWEHTIGGTWNVSELLACLEEAGGVEDTDEYQAWNKKVHLLKVTLDGKENQDGLRKLVAAIREGWKADDFAAIDEALSKVDERLNDLRQELKEEHFVIPQKELELFDAIGQKKVIFTIDELRRHVLAQKQNYQSWVAWQTNFNNLYAGVKARETRVQELRDHVPPYLTFAARINQEVFDLTGKLIENADLQPTEVLSLKAKEIADQYPKSALIPVLQEYRQHTQVGSERIDSKLVGAQQLLLKIDKFISGTGRSRKPLTNRNNQVTLSKFVAQLWEQDASHPEVLSTLILLGRFQNPIVYTLAEKVKLDLEKVEQNHPDLKKYQEILLNAE